LTKSPNSFPRPEILINETATAAPNNSKTMETVVDVGSPSVEKESLIQKCYCFLKS
jgi:hypothetical protein